MYKNPLFFFLLSLILSVLNGQKTEIFVPLEIIEAYEKGTRSTDGRPGEEYFQNRADYVIHAEYNPGKRVLKGKEVITYYNHSETNLRYVVLRLYQNVFLKGGIRGRNVEPEDVHNGMKINRVVIGGKQLDPGSPIYKTQTNIVFPMSLPPGEQITIEAEWEFTMPFKTSNRFGCYPSEACFIAYWYPQVAVFDDIHGWELSDYMGTAEFYNNYGDFNVNITVPENYIIWATGELTNPDKVLRPGILERYNLAKTSGEVIHIIEEKDLKGKKRLTPKGSNTWKFTAENVNDFAFGTSNNFRWDGTSTVIKGEDGEIKQVFIETAYDIESINFRTNAEIAAWSVKDFSEDLPGIAFPYPKITVFNGGGGMEFPMIVNNGETDPVNTLFLTTHEIGHAYFPFMVGTNQIRHGWLDEGLVTMMAQEQHLKRDTSFNFRNIYLRQYPVIAGNQADVPPLVNSHFITDDIFQIHEYMRPSLAFWTLRDVLGHDLFRKCLQDFIRIWKWKHPTPWDFFNVFEKTSEMELGWFFDPWFGRFAYPDLKVSDIIDKDSATHIELTNAGGMPFPCALKIVFSDKSEEIHDLPATIWKNSPKFCFIYTGVKRVYSAELITDGYPDVNIENNFLLHPSLESIALPPRVN